MKRVLRLLAVALGIVAAGSCSDVVQPEPKHEPRPGELHVRFSGPDSVADSGLVFVMIAPTGVSASAPSGLDLYQREVTDSTRRFAIIGPLRSGATILTLAVPDLDALDGYHATLEAVSGANGELRPLTPEYSLSIAP